MQWLGGFVRGDWGYSFSDGRPVIDRVVERLPATLELMSASLVLAAVITLPLGVLPAIDRRWSGACR